MKKHMNVVDEMMIISIKYTKAKQNSKFCMTKPVITFLIVYNCTSQQRASNCIEKVVTFKLPKYYTLQFISRTWNNPECLICSCKIKFVFN